MTETNNVNLTEIQAAWAKANDVRVSNSCHGGLVFDLGANETNSWKVFEERQGAGWILSFSVDNFNRHAAYQGKASQNLKSVLRWALDRRNATVDYLTKVA